MKTLAQLVVGQRCRKGKAAGVTKSGSYWMAAQSDAFDWIGGYGGDGIGNNGPAVKTFLELRHYRDGTVRAFVRRESWHQNTGDRIEYVNASRILPCTTIEDVEAALLGLTDSHEMPVYETYHRSSLLKVLSVFGMPESATAPDEVTN